ncbi:MAG: flagellar M-ring protein FliF [Ruminococcus sp.]|nr:flagellar M-ring protein FliF [Ruminococcus sp.]
MGEKLKSFGARVKEWWGGLSTAIRRLILISLVIIVGAAIGLTIFLNSRTAGYVTLFPNMSAEETAEVYQYLQSENVEVIISSDGQLMVKEEQWDQLVYELAAKGYPQSAPSYSTYIDNLSMTMTDSEKKKLIIMELQDRLQTTINRIDGVKTSVVTISYPESSNYAWQQNTEKAKASVTLTLKGNTQFTSQNVQAIKNLVAYSAQQMSPDDVTVIDTRTGKELGGSAGSADEYEIGSRENYERIVMNRIEERVIEILSNPYGQGNVAAAAAVSVNYDKITEEMKKYFEENGNIVDWEKITYTGDRDGDNAPGGVTGEEDNTDVPSYPNEDEEAIRNDPDYYEHEIDNAVSYVLTQTEKAPGVIEDASVSITLKTKTPLTDADRDRIVALVKNATRIYDLNKITVFDWRGTDEKEEDEDEVVTPLTKNKLFWALVILGGILLLAIIIILIVTAKSKKKIKEIDKKNKQQLNQLEEELEDTRRRSLIEQANENNKLQKQTAEEVKKFAVTNPELTAAIIRSMINEQEISEQQGEEEEENSGGGDEG